MLGPARAQRQGGLPCAGGEGSSRWPGLGAPATSRAVAGTGPHDPARLEPACARPGLPAFAGPRHARTLVAHAQTRVYAPLHAHRMLARQHARSRRHMQTTHGGARRRSSARTYAHMHQHAPTCAHTRTDMHARTQTRTQTCAHADTHARAQSRPCLLARTHTADGSLPLTRVLFVLSCLRIRVRLGHPRFQSCTPASLQ
jgi:hypothetical protein